MARPVGAVDAVQVRIEASELRGQRFRCLPGCGFCCLCDPGLTPAEASRFQGPLARAVDGGGDGLRMVGQAGPCALLSADRSCTQYDLRPRGCRSFPFHALMAWRTQAMLNRGCPGTWVQGPPAVEGYDPGQALPPGREALGAARRGRAAWAEFRRKARAEGCYEPPGRVQRRLLACLPGLLDLPGLAAGLALAEGGGPVGPRSLARLRREAGPGAGEDLASFLEEQALATFAQEDPRRLPMAVEPESLAWHVYRIEGPRLARLAIGARGGLAPAGGVPLRPLPLMPMDPAAARAYAAHAGVVARRDLLVGLAAFMLDRLGYGEPLGAAALRELVAALGDLRVRAGFLARFAGEESLRGPVMARGVAFFDMDFLNAPAIGVAF